MIRNNWFWYWLLDFHHFCGFSSTDPFNRKLLQIISSANADVKFVNAFVCLCDLTFNVSVNKTVKFWLQWEIDRNNFQMWYQNKVKICHVQIQSSDASCGLVINEVALQSWQICKRMFLNLWWLIFKMNRNKKCVSRYLKKVRGSSFPKWKQAGNDKAAFTYITLSEIRAVSKLIFWLLQLAITATHASVTFCGSSTSWICAVALCWLSQKCQCYPWAEHS